MPDLTSTEEDVAHIYDRFVNKLPEIIGEDRSIVAALLTIATLVMEIKK